MNEKDVIYVNTGLYGTGIWNVSELMFDVYNPDNIYTYFSGLTFYQYDKLNYSNPVKQINIDNNDNLIDMLKHMKDNDVYVFNVDLYKLSFLIRNFFKDKIVQYATSFILYNVNENAIVFLHDDYFSPLDLEKVLSFKNAKYKIAISNWTKSRYEIMGFENIETIHLGVQKSIKKININKIENNSKLIN
jgi:hypothetical protein